MEVSSIRPEDFCQKVNLCQKVALISSQIREDSCGMCHRAIAEVLIKLKDPDTQVCTPPSFFKTQYVSTRIDLMINWISSYLNIICATHT